MQSESLLSGSSQRGIVESQQTGVIRTLVRLGCDSPELSILETGADAHALLTQRKCENAGVGGALSFERSEMSTDFVSLFLGLLTPQTWVPQL